MTPAWRRGLGELEDVSYRRMDGARGEFRHPLVRFRLRLGDLSLAKMVDKLVDGPFCCAMTRGAGWTGGRKSRLEHGLMLLLFPGHMDIWGLHIWQLEGCRF